jgi:hypothetical protein
MIDQNISDDGGGHAEKVSASLPLNACLIDEPKIGFVNQRSGLQSVAGALRMQVARGNAAQLIVNDRHKTIESALVASLPLGQKARKIARFDRAPRFMVVVNQWQPLFSHSLRERALSFDYFPPLFRNCQR